METQREEPINKVYLTFVVLFMFVLPVLSILINSWLSTSTGWWMLIGKWFAFWAVGLRILIAGIRQVLKPQFTAEEIFHIDDPRCHVIVRELGFGNICAGLIGVISLFNPHWRIVAAFWGGLFLGFAGINHAIRKQDSVNEMIPTISNLFVSGLLIAYVVSRIAEKLN